MATVTLCDGCSTHVSDADATLVGRYDPVVYCKTCLDTWRAHEQAVQDRHARLVRDYEADRKALREALKGGEPETALREAMTADVVVPERTRARAAGPTLARLPDDD